MTTKTEFRVGDRIYWEKGRRTACIKSVVIGSGCEIVWTHELYPSLEAGEIVLISRHVGNKR